MTRSVLERKPIVAGIERRLFLRQALSLGALTLLTGCDISDQRRGSSGLEADVAVERPRAGVPVPPRRARARPLRKAMSCTISATTPISPSPTCRSWPPRTIGCELSGLIENKRPWSVDELYALPQESQITRHVCVEGWSMIGKWSGARLGDFLQARRRRPHGQVCRLSMRRRLLRKHRHGDGAPPADDHGVQIRRRNPSGQIRLSLQDQDPDEARLQESEMGDDDLSSPTACPADSGKTAATTGSAGRDGGRGNARGRLRHRGDGQGAAPRPGQDPPRAAADARRGVGAERELSCATSPRIFGSPRATLRSTAMSPMRRPDSRRCSMACWPTARASCSPTEPACRRPACAASGGASSHAAQSLFDRGHGAVCLLNSDSPTLPTSLLARAARALAEDGRPGGAGSGR